MSLAVAHRGPDGQGLYCSADKKVIFAHRRLAIIDLSDGGHQPMVTSDGRFAITYNGEIYNYRELRDELLTLGARFDGASDTEVILEGYRHWGTGVLSRLRGMFAFAIHDVVRNAVVLARDRIGIKPLFIRCDSRGLYFCSELDGLMTVMGSGALNRTAVAQFLKFRYVPGTSTIWESVEKVGPGECLEVELSPVKVKRRRWWDLVDYVDGDGATLSIENALEEGLARMRESVAIHMRSDVPLGVLLSGGLDSTSALALMRDEMPEGEISAFTMGFGDDRDESGLAHSCAMQFGASHHTFEISSQGLLGSLDELARAYGEPLADSSAIPFRSLAARASRYVKVVLGGDGGDELFGGYKWYQADLAASFWPVVPFPMAVPRMLSSHPRVSRMTSAMRTHGQERLDFFHGVGFSDHELRLLIPGLETLPPLEGYYAELPIFVRDRLYDLKNFTVNSVLYKVDVSSMAHGLEVRVPYLDHDLLIWSMRLPAEALFTIRKNKLLLRSLMLDRLPENILRAPKIGFSLPLRRWADRISVAARDLLRDGVLVKAGVIDGKILEEILEGRCWEPVPKLWSLLVLEKWLSHRTAWL